MVQEQPGLKFPDIVPYQLHHKLFSDQERSGTRPPALDRQAAAQVFHGCFASAGKEAMEAIVEFDHKKSFVHYNFCHIAQWLQQPNTAIVLAPFQERYYHHPNHLLSDAPLFPNFVD